MSGYDAGRVKFLFVLTAILGIGVLMIVHEGGHYLAARMFGMRVLRFTRQMAARQESRNDTGSKDSLQARLYAHGAIGKIELSVRGSVGGDGRG